MQTVPVHQAKDRFSSLLQAVEDGDEIVITRHGRKIARIVRETENEETAPEVERLRQQALSDLKAFHERLSPDPHYQPGDWKAFRDAGRR